MLVNFGHKKGFYRFTHEPAVGSFLMVGAALLALLWANSPWSELYSRFIHSTIALQFNSYVLSLTLQEWVNDGLMALFFLLVGLELKRELLVGELSQRQKAIYPIVGAMGGMAVPAAIFLALNSHNGASHAWGASVSTDIAFALGLLSLLGDRVPLSLKVFLTSLAVVDDLGAMLIIALVYTDTINWLSLGVAMGLLLLYAGSEHFGLRGTWLFTITAVGVWIAILISGIHPSLAGLLLALVIPEHSKLQPRKFMQLANQALDTLHQIKRKEALLLKDKKTGEDLIKISEAATALTPPAVFKEHILHPVVTYAVLPLFALVNAGVSFQFSLAEAFTSWLTLGLVLALAIGKPLGILSFVWVFERLKLCQRPGDLNGGELLGGAMLAGIGFTMSIFIAELALHDELLNQAKMGILIAAVLAGVAGYNVLAAWLPKQEQPKDEPPIV